MTTENTLIPVEVACALPEKQKIIQLQVEKGTTALVAVTQSRIGEEFPELDINAAPMGIFSQVLGAKGLSAPGEYQLEAGDRVEIYRPLIADPKEVRKQRAEKTKKSRE